MIEKIKAFFSKKEKGEPTGAAPERIYPNCWGYSEWEDEYYQVVKEQNKANNQNKDIYDNFINQVVEKHVATTKQGDSGVK